MLRSPTTLFIKVSLITRTQHSTLEIGIIDKPFYISAAALVMVCPESVSWYGLLSPE
jgi:hypothetical protein